MVLSIFRYGQEDVIAPYLEHYLEAADTVIDTLGFHKGSVVLEYGFPKPLGSTETLALLVYNEAFGSFRLGTASAIGVLMLAIALVVVLLAIRPLRREYF